MTVRSQRFIIDTTPKQILPAKGAARDCVRRVLIQGGGGNVVVGGADVTVDTGTTVPLDEVLKLDQRLGDAIWAVATTSSENIRMLVTRAPAALASDLVQLYEGWWRAEDLVGDTIPNKGQAGPALDATNTGLIPVDQAVWTPGVAGNGVLVASPPDTPAGPVEWVWRCSRTSWTSPSGRWPQFASRSRHEYEIYQTSNTSDFSLGVHNINDAYIWVDMGAVLTDGVAYWFKITYDAGTPAVANLYYQPDTGNNVPPTTGWIQSPNDPVGAGASGDIANTTNGLGLGARPDDSQPAEQTLYYWTESSGFTFDAATDLPTDPAATEFICTTGQEITVNRGTSGPVTVLAPLPVLVNPDDSDTENVITVDQTTEFDIADTDDAILIWVGQTGIVSAGTLGMARTGTGVDRMAVQQTVLVSSSMFNDGSGSVTAAIPHNDATKPEVRIAVLDRATDLIKAFVYDAGGLVGTNTADSTGSVSITPISPFRSMRSTPGTFSSALWNKGVGIAPSDDELAAIAAYLLEGYS